MRGVINLVVGLFELGVVMLFAAPFVAMFADVIVGIEVVQSIGAAQHVLDLRDTVLRWGPLAIIASLVLGAATWYFRRERVVQEVPRRP